MHARHMLLALTGLALGGCYLDPEDPLFAYGRVLDAQGLPREGATVELWRSVCAAGTCGAPSEELERLEHFATVTSEADGSWVGEVTYRDTFLLERGQSMPREWQAVYQPDPALPPVRVSFNFFNSDLDLPPMRPWDPGFRMLVDEAGIAVAVSAPPTVGQPPGRSDQFGGANLRTELASLTWKTADGDIAWSILLLDKLETVLPLELAEDFALDASLGFYSQGLWTWSANAVNPLGAGYSYSTLVQEFPPVPLVVPGPPRIPVSRGLPCTALIPGGETSAPLSPCPATDGSVAFTIPQPGEPVPASVGAMQLDFPTPVTARLVIIRGAGSFGLKTLVLEGRAEGQEQWHQLAELETQNSRRSMPNEYGLDFETVTLPPEGPALAALRLREGAPFTAEDYERARVSIPGGLPPGFLQSVHELSVFE